ncbi:hypothetical protein ACJ41O_011721 [Fusarium nematophilum]
MSSPAQADAPSFKRIQIFTQGDVESLFPLIAAYAQHPSLADSVEEVALDATRWGDRHSQPVLEYRPIDDATYATIETQVSSLGLGSFERSVLDALSKQRRELAGQATTRGMASQKRSADNGSFAMAAVVTLLAMCKNISTIYLARLFVMGTARGRGAKPISFVGRFLESLKQGDPPQARCLQNLKRIEMIEGVNSFMDPPGHDDFTTPFYFLGHLPALEELVADAVIEYQNDPFPYEKGSSNVKRIEIRHTDLATETVSKILQIPRGLEEFTLSLGGVFFPDGGSPSIELGSLRKNLALHKETLKKLDLDVNIALSWPYDDEEEEEEDEDEEDEEDRDGERPSKMPRLFRAKPRTTLGSLADFQALTHLSIGPKVLIPSGEPSKKPSKSQPALRLIEILPPSLKHLCLYGYEKGESAYVDGEIEELLEKKAERLPDLKEVRGVDEMVEDTNVMYGDEQEEYERPERSFDWVRV